MAFEGLMRATLDALYFSGAQALAKPWLAGLGSILMMHRVRDENYKAFSPNAHLSVSPAFLDQMLGKFRQNDVDFITIDEVHARLSGKASGNRFVCLTLDDGYLDNIEQAVPIFRKHQVPFTIYLATGLIEGEAFLWWEILELVLTRMDRILLPLANETVELDLTTPAHKTNAYNQLMRLLTSQYSETEQRRFVRELAWSYKVDINAHTRASMMRWADVRELAKEPLCTIGGHTINHYNLTRMTEEQVRFEIREGCRILEAELGKRPSHIAYPYGHASAVGEREIKIARKLGFTTAVTTLHDVIHPRHGANLLALPRLPLNGRFQTARHVSTLLSGLPTRIVNQGRRLDLTST